MNYKTILEKAQKKLDDNDYSSLKQAGALQINLSKCIIVNQFTHFGKANPECNRLLKDIQQLKDIRCHHILCTFLLGIYAYNHCCTIRSNVKKVIQQYNKQSFHKDFFFLWFLICLFHDLGYTEEEKKRNRISLNKHLGDITNVPELYKNVYENYFVYRKLEHNKIDHGIFAGLTMYKDLCKNREQKAREIKRADLWNPSLIPLYNLASWIVLAHNIWFVKDTDIDNCKIYQKYRLEQLILKTNTNNGQNEIANYPIKLSQHPLLFLFCLVDLIEPMKRIGCMDCCDKIDFRITKNKLIIKSNIDCNLGQEYIKNITSANDWLTITERNNNTVTIPLA